MAMMLQDREVLMRSADADWTYELWEQLSHDEYRYEIISDLGPLTRAYRRVARIPADGELVSPTLPFRAPVASFFAGTPG
jgi:hypothetical protein